MNTNREAIIAPSTSLASDAAISVIRISGNISFDEFQKFIKLDLDEIRPRYCHFTQLIQGQNIIDDIVLVYFKGPHSFTGEDVLEIHAHGNKLNTKRILNLFINSGLCRLAKRGEFAHRAFLNKKMSLIEIEGLERVINAKTPLALSSGMSLLSGKLNQEYTELYQNFLKLKSGFELGIDFLEDIGEEGHKEQLADAIVNMTNSINQLYYKAKHFNKELLSPQVAVFGIPNAGKSSFFNALLNFERSIVSSMAGTTRDYVSEYLELENTSVKLIDTAGIRTTENEIESIGIKQSLEIYNRCIFKILIINVLDTTFLNTAHDLHKKQFDLVVFTHCENIKNPDILDPFLACVTADYYLTTTLAPSGPIGPVSINSALGPIGPLLKKAVGPIGPLPCFNDFVLPSGQQFKSSGPIGPDDKLLKLLEKLILFKIGQVSPDGVVAERHVSVIEEIHKEWQLFLQNSAQNEDIAIVLAELSPVEEAISELVGQIVSDQVLNNIFDNFCIGK